MAELRAARDLIGGAVLAFLVLFSLVPAGVMPVATTHGVAVVICTGHGPLEIAPDPQTGGPAGKSGQGSPCDWAMAHGLFSLPYVALPVPTGSGAFVIAQDRWTTVLAHAHATVLPPATGPPFAS
ncbi:hypothetical protein [Martelella endophytica]|uniref:DUF2946 domain-containing protein n=1 Tax=Martelella endophytica TaxID=1486262 RepID=A0A0D5LMA8_MAREN|nr:hypothetical protein [Martelella endophytica]AJY45090.1 hypothetical protein TM49_04315 [Martelella endophytica]